MSENWTTERVLEIGRNFQNEDKWHGAHWDTAKLLCDKIEELDRKSFKWTNVKDALPDEAGWYLVFAPTYSGGSSSGLDMHDGVMFSQFKITKDGKKSWSIEVGYHKHPNCVLYWMPLPIPTDNGHFEIQTNRYGGKDKIWIDNKTGESSCLQ